MSSYFFPIFLFFFKKNITNDQNITFCGFGDICLGETWTGDILPLGWVCILFEDGEELLLLTLLLLLLLLMPLLTLMLSMRRGAWCFGPESSSFFSKSIRTKNNYWLFFFQKNIKNPKNKKKIYTWWWCWQYCMWRFDSRSMCRQERCWAVQFGDWIVEISQIVESFQKSRCVGQLSVETGMQSSVIQKRTCFTVRTIWIMTN